MLYLSFDDGPDPVITPFVLDELAKYGARATFFCIGKNVLQYPVLYNRILAEGHAVGNHSFSHQDGWNTEDAIYLADIMEAKKHIHSNLFRPPYGRIKMRQQRALSRPEYGLKTVMWSVLSGDFDETISREQCCKNVIRNVGSGAVIVFHDSPKANEKMRYALPVVLKHFSECGYSFEKIVL